MSLYLKIPIWVFIASMCVGFRLSPGRWEITKEDPTLWIRVCESNSTIEENDITDENDPLAGRTNLTMDQVLQTVIDDYNNIPTSFVRLAMYPTDPSNPGTPAEGDSTFTLEKAERRTIDICFGETNPAAGVSGAYAQPKYEGRKLIGCSIHSKPEHAKKLKFLVHLLTHEMGHCFSLMHPQENTRAVMSYFYKDLIYRLKNDDMAGITSQYPMEESYAKEDLTWGLSGCEPKEPQ